MAKEVERIKLGNLRRLGLELGLDFGLEVEE